ncbi:MAG: helix-turn-helix domain-containing protein [Candidatus Thermoplasmatota archaeon]|nr:helix-turn-helix domain-containing protein [Candidatus Thermoplasmatota archaeon]MCL5665918.1 helix-turn-helix domain-containing protein [Candidatus Thermoplasmatota archaeon]
MTEDLDEFIAAMVNNTRRAILRRLTMEESYAMELSRLIGISQQAVIKHLSQLEQAKLISSVGLIPSREGASRKIYRPTGFSTLVVDYSRNFFSISKRDIPLTRDTDGDKDTDLETLVGNLNNVNNRIEELMRRRTELIQEKDKIIREIRKRLSEDVSDQTSIDVISLYLDTLDVTQTAEASGVPEFIVKHVLKNYGFL